MKKKSLWVTALFGMAMASVAQAESQTFRLKLSYGSWNACHEGPVTPGAYSSERDVPIEIEIVEGLRTKVERKHLQASNFGEFFNLTILAGLHPHSPGSLDLAVTIENEGHPEQSATVGTLLESGGMLSLTGPRFTPSKESRVYRCPESPSASQDQAQILLIRY